MKWIRFGMKYRNLFHYWKNFIRMSLQCIPFSHQIDIQNNVGYLDINKRKKKKEKKKNYIYPIKYFFYTHSGILIFME